MEDIKPNAQDTGSEIINIIRKKYQTEWGYQEEKSKRYENYKVVHSSILGGQPSFAELDSYDRNKDIKSSLVKVRLKQIQRSSSN
jgi:hypothetical protein